MIALASCPLHAKTILWWARSCLGPQCPKRAVSPIQVFKNCSKSVQTEAMVDSMVAESHLTFGDRKIKRPFPPTASVHPLPPCGYPAR